MVLNTPFLLNWSWKVSFWSSFGFAVGSSCKCEASADLILFHLLHSLILGDQSWMTSALWWQLHAMRCSHPRSTAPVVNVSLKKWHLCEHFLICLWQPLLFFHYFFFKLLMFVSCLKFYNVQIWVWPTICFCLRILRLTSSPGHKTTTGVANAMSALIDEGTKMHWLPPLPIKYCCYYVKG